MVYIRLLIELFICIISFLIAHKIYKKEGSKFKKNKQDFVDYLDSMNDTETLRKIGIINIFGERETWFPSYGSIVKYLKKKISETNDANFIKYLEDYKKMVKVFMCTMPFMMWTWAFLLNDLLLVIQNR